MFKDPVWLAGKVSASALAKRFEAVAQNIANVNTPGYKRKEVEFEDALREALESEGLCSAKKVKLEVTDEKHIGFSKSLEKLLKDGFKERVVTEGAYRLDGNNVDPEVEMAKMTETRLAYNGIMRIMSKRMEMLKTAMGGK